MNRKTTITRKTLRRLISEVLKESNATYGPETQEFLSAIDLLEQNGLPSGIAQQVRKAVETSTRAKDGFLFLGSPELKGCMSNFPRGIASDRGIPTVLAPELATALRKISMYLEVGRYNTE